MNIQRLIYQNLFWRGLFFLSAFLLNVLVARNLAAATTGWLYYLFTLFSFFTLIGSFSLEAAILYFGSRGEIDLRSLARLSWIWTLGSAAAICLTFAGTALMNFPVSRDSFYFALCFICGNLLVTFMSALFYADRNYRTSNVAAITTHAFLIVCVLLLDKATFVPIYFLSYPILGAALSILVLLRTQRVPSVPKGYLPKMLRYSALAFATNVVFFLLYKIDYWFVNQWVNDRDLGNYIQVSKVVHLFFLFPGVIAQSLFPLFAGGHVARAAAALQLLSRAIFFVYLLVCLLLVFTGEWLFPAVFGGTFSHMYVPFLLLIPGILALAVLYPVTAWFSANNRIRVNLTGSILATLVIVAGDALFIPHYGIHAAAIVSSIGYAVYHAYVMRVFTKMHAIRYLAFFQFRPGDFRIFWNLTFKSTQ